MKRMLEVSLLVKDDKVSALPDELLLVAPRGKMHDDYSDLGEATDGVLVIGASSLVELGEEIILVRHGDDWLKLSRTGARIDWRRADGSSGLLEFTEAGRLRPVSAEEAPQEEEMDMMAEAWARELML